MHKLVLALSLAMAVASPFMQIKSLDQFPVNSDDLEIQIICCLCLVGITLVLAGMALLAPRLMRERRIPPISGDEAFDWSTVVERTAMGSPPLGGPLRI